MPATILDWTGSPAIYSGSGNLYQRDEADMRLRPLPRSLFDDYLKLLSPTRWRQLLSESRTIASRGQVAAAIWQKADYVSASHWRPYFTGEDSDWGEQAEKLLEDTKNNCCTRGDRFPWRALWRMSIPTRAADGGFFVLLTSNADGWPLLQPIEAHRIGQRGSGQTVGETDALSSFTMIDGTKAQQKGVYAGLRIVNGIIYSRQGMEVAYRVLGATSDQDEDISAQDMIHIGAPRWYSEGRPLPEIAPALLDLAGIQMSRTAQLDGQIIDSKLTVIEENQTGTQDQLRNAINPSRSGPTGQMTNPELVERGTFRYVKSGSGSVKPYESRRPSAEWMGFDQRMSSVAIAAIGWRMEMLDPSDLRGAATRGFQDQINTAILNSFHDASPAVVRCTRYRIAKFIQLGMLKDHPEFMSWDVAPPPEFTVDRGQLKTDLDGVRTGAEAMPFLQRRLGYQPRHVLVSQAKYEKMKDQIAAQYGIDPQRLGSLTIPSDKTGYTGGPDSEQTDPNALPVKVAQP